MNHWSHCKNILCIRPDNMGDIIMTGPALRALKQTFGCRITLLTSKMGALITPYIPEIDEAIVCTLPWVKSNDPATAAAVQELAVQLKEKQFDAAIIFTVYSQNPLPSAVLAFMAEVPLRLAYCRENPYDLLTDWIPDEEPYKFIQHQVERDLNLVQQIGATADNNRLQLFFSDTALQSAQQKLQSAGFNFNKNFIILHPGVSEKKREVPLALWIGVANRLFEQTGLPLLITGSEKEQPLARLIAQQVKGEILNAAGLFSIEEFIAIISQTKVVVSVNTATAHIAAATQTPVVVLYALTNPQHTPWQVPGKVLSYSVNDELKSRNQVVEYVSSHCMETAKPLPEAEEIVQAVVELMDLSSK